MSSCRRRSRLSRGALAFAAFLGAAALAGPAAVTPAYASTTPRQQEWHINAMRLPDAWKYSEGKGITVAVVDGGVDASLPDLRGQVLPGRDFSPNVPVSYTSEQGQHGTGMASLIAGTGRGLGGNGTVGVAPEAKILPVRVAADLNAANEGANEAVILPQMAQAIRFAADSSARIINISLGADSDPPALRSAVRYALSKGKLVVAAVGNSRQDGNPVQYPGGIPGVVGVGAVDKKGVATSESETGSQVALVAPGMDMYHACAGGPGYCVTHGTSDATAVVSGVAALVWAKHPDWSGNQVLRVIMNTAAAPSDGSKRNDYLGYGLVRPRLALETPGDPGPADVSPLLPASATPTAEPSAAVSVKAAAPTAKAASSSAAGSGSLPWIAGGAVLVVLLAIGGFVAVRRRAR